MVCYLQIENLTKSFGDRILFSNISFGINEGEKIGIIAKNGSGKSTLMNVITGKDGYDCGTITFRNNLKVGFLEQNHNFDIEKSIIETCLYSNDAASKVLCEYELRLSKSEGITNLIPEMDAAMAWDYEDRFKQILSQLNITDYTQKIKELSGGQIKRIALARVLINNPDLLLLDEPTNHLDIDMIEWLEDYLSKNKITLLMVTHDRYFLDKVCNKIIELDSDSIFTYTGNYDYYLEKRAERYENISAENAKAQNLYRKELDWMRRQPQARASKAKYRIDAFHDLKDKVSQNTTTDNVKLEMESSYIGSKIFEAKNVCKRYGDKIILDNFNYTFARFEKLGIIGANGIGKSTFIKMLQGIEPIDSGLFDIGETVKFGYYGQGDQEFDNNKKVIDVVTDIAEVIYFDEKTKLTASQFLQHFLFSPADQQKYVNKLSGGEKRRLYLATVLISKPNFLILDEPTNDLDIVTLEILENYIEKFKGCVIIVSHDRFFMDRCVDHIFVFEGNGNVKDFPGNYSEFRDWKIEQNKIESASKSAIDISESDKGKRPKRSTQKVKLTYKEKIEFESLESELKVLEVEKSSIEKIFNGEVTTDKNINDISIRYAEIKDIIDEKELRWLELSEKV